MNTPQPASNVPPAPAFPAGRKISPMEAVVALYGKGDDEAAQAIVASLSRSVFEGRPPRPSNLIRRGLGVFAFRLMDRTTEARTRVGPDGHPVTYYSNRILENSGHPYAATLLEPSRADTSFFVEGGDPMNALYMMLVPEIRKTANRWDHIMLDAVQSRDCQWRFVWETRMAHALATSRLKLGQPVRLKAAAAGTGLSMIVVLDRLLREGHDPGLISAAITDREGANVDKALRLLEKLPSTRPHIALHANAPCGILPHVEDLLHPTTKTMNQLPFDIVTLVGLLEYFPGFTFSTTEEHLGQPAPEGPPHAADLVRNIGAMTAEGGFLITNTFRLKAAIRTMEVFGKRFRYRGRKEMAQLLAQGGFATTGHCVSANIFDVEVYEKKRGDELSGGASA